ncbi:hypothetical protein [Pyxidicoccus xibeiensis]|uniref:hypothetical protein n=1 Tax=Pyxidicoccus xibeiensis TaxID=2906759 RepID=UPI0020A785AB|nr:hypothetical protein [Pyxidicoccus xibeiensis]MCP3144085.1 hypothetical protein [Pyxidicoccus xibeiensis]
MAETPTTKFLNVDLELRCESGLLDLVRVLEPHCVVLHETPRFACLELATHPRTVEEALLGFGALIQALPGAPRATWERCEQRRFDIGIHAGLQPHSTPFGFSSRAVRMLADLGAEVGFTVYAPDLTARSG